MLTAKHTGKYGDVVVSIPAMRALGVTTLYLPERGPETETMFGDMRTLMDLLGFNTVKYPDCDRYGTMPVKVDYDMDSREHPLRGVTNLVQRYYDVFNLGTWQPAPWIQLNRVEQDYSIVNVTPRFRDNSRVNWSKVLRSVQGEKFFVGTVEEHRTFARQWGDVEYLPTADVLTLAKVIAGAKAVYCNQSLVLALSVSMMKKRYVEFKYMKRNCKFLGSEEFELI